MLLSGDIITLYRDMALERLTSYTNGGDFLAADVNNDYDRLWLALQQNTGTSNRALVAPNTDPTNINMTIPDKATRLDKFLKFNATTGNPEASTVADVYVASGFQNYNFTGNGSTTAFTLGIAPFSENNTQVYIDGVYQEKGTYSVSGTTLTFSTAPPNLSGIEVMVVEVLPSGSNSAANVTFKQAGSSTQRTVQAKLEESVSVKDFGAVGDSNGTTGNGTDDTAAIQAAIDYANLTGREVYIPTGTYRITSSLDFTGAQTKSGFIGESNFNTIIFVDFTSASKVAALSLDNGLGVRAYVAFKNFRIQGLNAANISGIYTNYASEFTEFENVWVINCENGFVIAHDYNVNVTRCQAWYNTNNGFQIGIEIDGVTNGSANNVTLQSCLATYNAANGFYIRGSRALSMDQCDGEANDYTNINLNTVYGASLTGTYMEYGSLEVGNPYAQLLITNCTGIVVNSLSVSAFDDNANPVIRLETNNNAISFSGIAIETAGGPTSSIGMHIGASSFGVSVRDSYLNGLSTGILLNGNARIIMSNVNFSNATLPFATDAIGAKSVVWEQATAAQIAASTSQIASNVVMDYTEITGDKNLINMSKLFTVSVDQADLASTGTKILLDAVLLSEQWRIVDIFVVGLTAFSGGGGDRNIAITNGTNVYTSIPAASLATGTSLQGRWGGADVPFSALYYDMLQPTPVGLNLVAQYSGGSTDYTAGTVSITVIAQRIA